MEQKKENRPLRGRVGLSVAPADPAMLVAALVEIEETGVGHIWVGGPPWNPDLLTTLAATAMRTTHLTLGTAIVQIFSRHPVLLAQQALSLNALARGRLRLGIGTSSPAFAKLVYGVEMEPPLAYLREYVQVLRLLLQQGEVHHQGHYFTVDASLQASSQVPLLIAALGPVAFRLAGEIADGALPALCPIPYLLNTAPLWSRLRRSPIPQDLIASVSEIMCGNLLISVGWSASNSPAIQHWRTFPPTPVGSSPLQWSRRRLTGTRSHSPRP